MANYDANKIRNIVFLGHQSSGKTSLVESLYFLTGGTNQKGEVEKKNTVSDYTPEEQKRGASIQTAVVPVYKGDVKVNLIDVPGNDDFIGEYLGVLTAVDGAVIVIDASTGVQVGTVKHYNALRRKGIPTILFVNKMDKEGVDVDAVIDAIKAQLNKDAVCFISTPLDYQIAAQEVYGDFLAGIDKTVQNRCNNSGTGAGSAGESLAGATFPDPHPDCTTVFYISKLSICSLREELIVFKEGPNFTHRKVSRIFINKDNCMRISHRHAGSFIFDTTDCKRVGNYGG